MKLEQISYILEIAKQGSIGKAAKKLYMSQPNLSMSIRMLEEELGFKAKYGIEEMVRDSWGFYLRNNEEK